MKRKPKTRFKTQLKDLLSTFDRNEKLTPAEILERLNGSNGNGIETILTAAFNNARFVKEVVANAQRDPKHRVVVYIKGDGPAVMTLKRHESLQKTIKKAHKGLREYHENNRKKREQN